MASFLKCTKWMETIKPQHTSANFKLTVFNWFWKNNLTNLAFSIYWDSISTESLQSTLQCRTLALNFEYSSLSLWNLFCCSKFSVSLKSWHASLCIINIDHLSLVEKCQRTMVYIIWMLPWQQRLGVEILSCVELFYGTQVARWWKAGLSSQKINL